MEIQGSKREVVHEGIVEYQRAVGRYPHMICTHALRWTNWSNPTTRFFYKKFPIGPINFQIMQI